MISEAAPGTVYLALGSTDLRKSIDGLAVLVKEGFELDPFSSCLFVFCNRKRDKIKILHWEHNGFGCTTAAWNGVHLSGPRNPLVLLSRSAAANCAGY